MIVELLIASAMTLGAEPSDEPEGCAVAVRYVEGFLADHPGQYVFSARTHGWPSHMDRSYGGDEPALDPGFRDEINAAPQSSAVEACGSLRAFLDRQGLPYGDEAVDQATKADDPERQFISEPFERTNITLTLPLLNEDRSEAFVQVGIFPHPRHCVMFSYTLNVTAPDLPVTRRRPGPLC